MIEGRQDAWRQGSLFIPVTHVDSDMTGCP